MQPSCAGNRVGDNGKQRPNQRLFYAQAHDPCAYQSANYPSPWANQKTPVNKG